MRKTILCAAAVLLSASQLAAQNKTQCGTPTGQERFPVLSYTELPQLAKPDPAEWAGVEGLNVSWGETTARYSATEVPVREAVLERTVSAWRGQRVFSQAVVWTGRKAEGIEYEATPLKGSSGKIAKSNFELGFTRYVMTDGWGGGVHIRPDNTKFDSTMVADCIDPFLKSKDLEPMQAQGLWFTCWVPQDAAPGRYTGQLLIKEKGKVVGELTLKIDVEDKVLPLPQDWSFHLDLWQNPYAVSRYYQVEPWSEEHFDAMRPIMTRLGNAGQKIISASIIDKPWNGQTEDPFGPMIQWTKKKDGSWSYDYSIFDRWIPFAESCGVSEQINCYSMVPWRLSFSYFDEASGSMTELAASPGEKAYEEFWVTFLKDFSAHLREKGWFEKTTIAMDERPMEAMLAVIDIIKKADPGFKLSLAGNYYPEIEEGVYDYCIFIDQAFPKEVLEKRGASGLRSTFYTCCGPETPNTFTFSPLSESVYIPLHSLKHGFDGYLRWAFISWPLEPLLDTRFRTWPAGDTFLVYPGNRTSMRFENLVEGIQMYEKFKISSEGK